MERGEIVKIVSDKLDIEEEVVDKVFMHQFKSATEAAASGDANYIYMPYIGTFKFRVHTGANIYDKLLNKVERWKLELETATDLKRIKTLISSIDHNTEVAEALKAKISFVNNKYGGIRTKIDDRRLGRYKDGIYFELVKNLRSERYKENMEEQEKPLEN